MAAVALILLTLIYGAIGAQPTDSWVTWVVLGVSLLAGLIAGLLLLKYEKVAIFVLGAIGGWMLAFTLYDLVLYKISEKVWVLWVFVGVLALLCGILALKVWEHAIIVITAFLGGYVFNKSVSVWAGGFPNEIELYHYLEGSHGSYSIETTYYYYFAGIVIATIIGTIAQEKHKNKRKERQQGYRQMNP